ncbi:MAG: Uma2 family endonuclease [Gammaproteobacteria bacterium]|nr:Uma2 family endonuclease [Gammaproteobacteria bacterium]
MLIGESAPKRYPFTIAHYQKMIETGIFDEDEHVELIEGELIVMMPIGPVHSSKIRRLIHLFSQAAGDSAMVDAQDPIVLDDYSEPEPDIALLRPRDDYYEEANPKADDVLLLVEVADTSLSYDKKIKIPLYARHGVPEVWLINVPDRQVEIYLNPSPKGYRKILLPEKHEHISPALLPDVSVKVSDILGLRGDIKN